MVFDTGWATTDLANNPVLVTLDAAHVDYQAIGTSTGPLAVPTIP